MLIHISSLLMAAAITLTLSQTSAFSTPTPSTFAFSPSIFTSLHATTTQPEIVNVELGPKSYPIYIGSDLLNSNPSTLLDHIKGKQVLIISNDKIGPLYMDKVVASLKAGNENLQINTLLLPDGEQYKNMEILSRVTDCAMELALDRKSTFIALGGGVIGDMVGFAAAIYQRGVNFIQYPTSVMAMVDSSVGGKTGVNHKLGKNMIGAFHQPQCVFIDTDTLDTLPDRELKSGISEIIKYGLIRDAEFFVWMEHNIPKLLARDPIVFAEAIKRSCENKAEVVASDEFEAGLRATLNLGHTFGHAVENGSGYGHWLHGEAVSIGTAMAATMSAKMGWIDQSMLKRIYAILKLANLPTALPKDSPMTYEKFRAAMSIDKKVANGVLRLILLKGELGKCTFTSEFEEKALEDTIREFVDNEE